MIIIHQSNQLAASTGGGITSDAASELRLIVELLPPDPVSQNYQTVGARLSVGGINIPIVSYEESADEQNAGKTFTVQLGRPEDKSLLTPDAEFLIETHTTHTGAPVWEIAFQGKINSKSVSVANSDGKPSDSVSFTSVSTNRLKKRPLRNLVIYDSSRSEVDASEFEPVYDTSGRVFSLDTLEISGLSLHTLFDEIFVERCGFASVKTNLPDYPVRRADFSIFGTYYDGIKPFIGVFRALDFQTADNVLWIIERTATLPAGFPAPRQLPPAKIQSLSSETQLASPTRFELQFSQSEEGDFFTTKTETFPMEVRTEFGTLISKTVTKIKTRQYRSNYARNIILREAVEKETVETYGADTLQPAAITEEIFTFDYLGRFKSSTKTVKKRMPDMTAGGLVSLREVASDYLKHKYAVHPFAARRQFLKRTELISQEIMAIDSENKYLDEDFPQALTLAHRSGNLKDGMTEDYGVTKSVVEDFKPLPDGTVKTFRTEIDHTPEFVGRDAIVTTSIGEPRAGDVSVSSQSRPGKLYVALKSLSDAEIRTESLPVGELPLYLAVPLAERLLEAGSPERFSIPLVGWNKTVEQGGVFQAFGRNGESFNVIITGYRKNLRSAGNGVEAGMTLTAEKI
jgi:hypothetical protein